MKSKRTEAAFLARVKGQLDESVDGLDAETRSRLTQARYQALSGLEKRSPWWRGWSLPTGALATALVVVLAVGLARPPTSTESVSDLEDLELLSANESFELLEELEFYEWLPAEQETG